MKKLSLLLISTVLFFGLVSAVNATPITFTDTENVNTFVGWWESVSYTHNFEFDPAAESVLSGSLSVEFRDDGGFFDSWEVAFGFAESGEWDVGEVNTGWVNDYSVDVAYLADGEFNVTIASLWGDFYVETSELTVTYAPAPVPEPATLILMGLGLVGLAGASRKKWLKK